MLNYFLKSCAGILLSLLLVSNALCGIDFDGTDDYISITDSNNSLDITGTAITISAWIYPTVASPTNGGYILVKSGAGGASPANYQFYQDSGRSLALECDFYNAGWNTHQSGLNVLTLNAWQHILWTYDGTNVKFYVNGSSVFTEAENTAMVADNENAWIGGTTTATGTAFKGIVDEVAVWNVVLSANQIALLASSRLKGMPLLLADPDADGTQELMAYWPLDEGTHGNSADLDTAWDMSGNGNNGNPDNGANNTGLSWAAEVILDYPSPIIGAN